MKRFITLLMAAVMVLGLSSLAAAAVEFSASGHMHINFSVLDNVGFDKDAKEDNFFAAQRFRPKLTMKADGVTAVFEAQQHQVYWGTIATDETPYGFAKNSPNIDFRLRQAYLDFKLPSTPVSLKVGFQDLALPSIWGHPVFYTRVGGVVATIPFNDNVALVPFWARPEYDGTVVATAENYNSVDMFGALLPINAGTVSATPYFVYARVGDNATENQTLMVGGANLNVMPTDALNLKADLVVTDHSADAGDLSTGWMLAAAVDYELPWGTPGALAWYATGYDKNGEDALFSYETDGFGPTSWGFAGGNTFAFDSQINWTGVGTWAFGLQIADMSFVDSLKHTVRLVYGQGTTDEKYAGDADVWTEKDSFFEANLDSTWSIYENLAAVIELGAILPDFGKKGANAGRPDDMAMKAQLTLRFSF